MTVNLQNADDLINAIKASPDAFPRSRIQKIADGDEWLTNCALNTYEYIHQCEEVTTYPLDVVLPMTCWCNASCLFCNYCKNERFYLDPNEIVRYKGLLRHVKNYGFSSYGEPLVHPKFDEYTQAIKAFIDPRATTYLVTNGILLHRYLNTIKRYCNSVSISLNAASAGVHSKTMRVDRKCFAQIIESIIDLVRYKELYNDKFNIQLSFAVVRTNLHEITDFIKLAQKLKVNKIYFNTLNLAKKEDFTDRSNVSFSKYQEIHPAKHPNFDLLKKDALDALKEAKIPYQASPEGWGMPSIYNETYRKRKNKSGATYHCSYLYQRLLMAGADEAIRICCFINNAPGYKPVIYTDSSDFLSKWNSAGFRKLRRTLKIGNLPKYCEMCTLYEKNIFR